MFKILRVDIEHSHSNGVIGEEHEGPPPYSGRRRRLPPPDCCRSDARSDRARTSPTVMLGVRLLVVVVVLRGLAEELCKCCNVHVTPGPGAAPCLPCPHSLGKRGRLTLIFAKKFFAALVECVAATVPHALEQRLH